jgi:hypothetical protein
MRLLLSYFLYYLGDAISRVTILIGSGCGFRIYNKIMLWSVELDTQGRIWKYVLPKRKKRKK